MRAIFYLYAVFSLMIAVFGVSLVEAKCLSQSEVGDICRYVSNDCVNLGHISLHCQRTLEGDFVPMDDTGDRGRDRPLLTEKEIQSTIVEDQNNSKRPPGPALRKSSGNPTLLVFAVLLDVVLVMFAVPKADQ